MVNELSQIVEALTKKINPDNPLTIIEAEKMELRLYLAHDSHWHVCFRNVNQDLGHSVDALLFNYVIISQKVTVTPEDYNISLFVERISRYVEEYRDLLIKEITEILKRFMPSLSNE